MRHTDGLRNMSIVADWGTSRLRVMLCEGRRLVDQRTGSGIAAIVAANRKIDEEFVAVAGDWLGQFGQNGVTLCGMVGSNIGWVQAPYIDCPADLSLLADSCVKFEIPSANIAIVSGLACNNHLGAPDVMRGEETQILGALELQPSLRKGRRVLCLPGTHSKWVVLESGVVQNFSTSPTGEFFSALGERSVLVAAASESEIDQAAFDHGLDRSLNTPSDSLPFVLFEARSRTLREGMPKSAARDFLSGLLIGAEIKAAKQIVPGFCSRGQEVIFIGDPGMTERYARACTRAHGTAREIDGGQAALTGLLTLNLAVAVDS